MPTILIVDDDKNLLLSLQEGLKTYDHDLHVLTSENGSDALEIMKMHHVDLMITDLKMPKMDGFELCAYMVSHYPHIPVIVMTAFATYEMEYSLFNMGTFVFLEKPLDFNILVEKIKAGLEVRSHYYIKVLSLCSYLQMMENEKKTCTISVRSLGKMGHIFFLNGILIDAATEDKVGEDALNDIVKWESAEIELNRTEDIKPRAVNFPLNFIFKRALTQISQSKQKMASHPLENPEKKETQDGGNVPSNIRAVNVDKLNKAMDILRDELGEGLIGTGIVLLSDGKTITDYNSNPRAEAMFSQITRNLMRELKECDMPPLGKYYLIHLADDRGILAIPLGEFEWRIFVDFKKIPLGLLLNIVLPKILDAFQEAMEGPNC